MKIFLRVLFISFSSVIWISCTEGHAQDNPAKQFKISVQNVTAGNLLSPYLAIVHKSNSHIFDVGMKASAGLQQLAETGATDIIQSELSSNSDILSVTKAEGMPVVAGEVRDVTLNVSQDLVDSDAVVTVIAMIGKSNDSFIAVESLPLKEISAKPTRIEAKNFDAGTEENTGNIADLNASGHPTAAAEGKISYDRGFNPNGDAPEILRWGSVAATASIQALN